MVVWRPASFPSMCFSGKMLPMWVPVQPLCHTSQDEVRSWAESAQHDTDFQVFACILALYMEPMARCPQAWGHPLTSTYGAEARWKRVAFPTPQQTWGKTHGIQVELR